MEKRHKIEVGVAIAVLLGLFIFLFLFLRNSGDIVPTENDGKSPTTVDRQVDALPVDSADIPTQSVVSAQTTARNFVERFGSFSSDVDYLNIDDVLPLATASLQRELRELAEDARENTSDAYYGISTKAIIFTIEEENDTSITMLVTSQRQESIDSPGNTTVRNQQIRLVIVTDGDGWLVDSFTWLE